MDTVKKHKNWRVTWESGLFALYKIQENQLARVRSMNDTGQTAQSTAYWGT